MPHLYQTWSAWSLDQLNFTLMFIKFYDIWEGQAHTHDRSIITVGAKLEPGAGVTNAKKLLPKSF